MESKMIVEEIVDYAIAHLGATVEKAEEVNGKLSVDITIPHKGSANTEVWVSIFGYDETFGIYTGDGIEPCTSEDIPLSYFKKVVPILAGYFDE